MRFLLRDASNFVVVGELVRFAMTNQLISTIEINLGGAYCGMESKKFQPLKLIFVTNGLFVGVAAVVRRVGELDYCESHSRIRACDSGADLTFMTMGGTSGDLQMRWLGEDDFDLELHWKICEDFFYPLPQWEGYR